MVFYGPTNLYPFDPQIKMIPDAGPWLTFNMYSPLWSGEVLPMIHLIHVCCSNILSTYIYAYIHPSIQGTVHILYVLYVYVYV